MSAENKIKKNDWIFFGVVLSVAVLILAIRFFVGTSGTGYVTVRIRGEITATYKLSEDRIEELNLGTNTMQIEDGTVKMIEADCPDQLCVHQKKISKNGENIICLPNNVVLEIVSQNEKALDAVTN